MISEWEEEEGRNRGGKVSREEKRRLKCVER